jgi:FixJ family two-component response regulator
MNTTSAICFEESSCLMTNAPPMVFVVDDDISMRESLGALIRDEGWQVETFMSAEEFLNRPHEIAPHCLVLDISMPGLNGLELQKRLAVQPLAVTQKRPYVITSKAAIENDLRH